MERRSCQRSLQEKELDLQCTIRGYTQQRHRSASKCTLVASRNKQGHTAYVPVAYVMIIVIRHNLQGDETCEERRTSYSAGTR